jgi:hypothetical protein
MKSGKDMSTPPTVGNILSLMYDVTPLSTELIIGFTFWSIHPSIVETIELIAEPITELTNSFICPTISVTPETEEAIKSKSKGTVTTG